MRVATTLAADGTVKLGILHKPRALTQWNATFFAKGTFGSGTIAWLWADNGDTSTLLPITDYSGAAVTSTSNDSFNVNFGNGNKLADQPQFFATLTGSTNPSITLGYYDNQ